MVSKLSLHAFIPKALNSGTIAPISNTTRRFLECCYYRVCDTPVIPKKIEDCATPVRI